MMHLVKLPPELLRTIWLNLESNRDRNAFIRTCRQCYTNLNTYLYCYAVQHCCALVAEWAGKSGRDDTLQKLIAAGADVVSDSRTSPLFVAAEHGQDNVIRLLIEKKIDLEMRRDERERRTALYLAAERGRRSTVELLLEAGAEIDATTVSGKTALRAAAFAGQDSVVLLLLQKGASAAVMDSSECTVLIHVVANCGLEAIRLAAEKTPKELLDKLDEFCCTALSTAAGRGKAEVVKVLLDAGADMEAGGKEETALRVAIAGGRDDVVRILLDAGASPNATDRQHAPLSLAANLGRDEIVQMLLERGADPHS